MVEYLLLPSSSSSSSLSSSNKEALLRFVPANIGGPSADPATCGPDFSVVVVAVLSVAVSSSSSPNSIEIPEKNLDGVDASFRRVAETLCSNSVGVERNVDDSWNITVGLASPSGGGDVSVRLSVLSCEGAGRDWTSTSSSLFCSSSFFLFACSMGGMVLIWMEPCGSGGEIITMGGAVLAGTRDGAVAAGDAPGAAAVAVVLALRK